MLRGIFKYLLHLFLGSIFIVFVGQTEAHSNSHTNSIIRHDVNIGCAENAVAPLNSIKDIQTFLNCNGFILVQSMVGLVEEQHQHLKAFKLP